MLHAGGLGRYTNEELILCVVSRWLKCCAPTLGRERGQVLGGRVSRAIRGG